MRISGSNGYDEGSGWTRLWLSGLIPVARTGGATDMARSAAARGIAEAAFWVPAALLPQNGVRWEPVDDDTARAVVEHRGERFTLDPTVAADGRPLSITIPCWSRENPARACRLQPFGGTVAAVGRFGGHTLVTRIERGPPLRDAGLLPFYRVRRICLHFH